MNFRNYQFLGATQSLCPECLTVVPAKILNRDGRVYFRKHCQEHGMREDFVCSDATWFDRHVGSAPGKVPLEMAVEPNRGCPYDCGLCTEHEQHTCLGLLEITANCNLECPMCFASSAPGLKHLSYDDCVRAIDHLVAAEGQPEVLQLSGGEPTIHPRFLDLLAYACDQPIDVVMINTNGVRLARDRRFLEVVAEHRKRAEVYLQFDGFDNTVYQSLRGEPLLESKLACVQACGELGINVTLVATLQAGVNFGANSDSSWLGRLLDFATERPWVTGVSFQPATYVGRHFLPEELEQRVTFPDVIHAIERETDGRWQESDFTPLPCAHPNAHTVAYGYRAGGRTTPLARLIDIAEHIDLLSGRITYTRPRARDLIQEVMNRRCCGSGGCCEPREPNALASGELPVVSTTSNRVNLGREPAASAYGSQSLEEIGQEFTLRALSENLDPCDMFRITTTSFMDAYNFDIRQLMKSCVHFVLPSGHIIPFSAYNTLYREGHVPLPELKAASLCHSDGSSATEESRLPVREG
ncbi:radical SAM protein [Aeoliella sp. ICT_H6.2]|uniref:Radical SAM protein n=1 Tax=Aeoliella straminimaris TaxID=2954799 RepID=A0A9X2FCZ1_9BACT|nr:radical SAM protein [Aeoliella straminimaris]MCO6046787.1 radical SAM protein [Aeoliella straminimaris]